MAWIPAMYKVAGGGRYRQGERAPPITAVVLPGLFWKRINAQGATLVLLVGMYLYFSFWLR